MFHKPKKPSLRTHTVRAYVRWAYSAGHTPDRIRRAVERAGYTRTAANLALRDAGHRSRPLRSDIGTTRKPYRRTK